MLTPVYRLFLGVIFFPLNVMAVQCQYSECMILGPSHTGRRNECLRMQAMCTANAQFSSAIAASEHWHG